MSKPWEPDPKRLYRLKLWRVTGWALIWAAPFSRSGFGWPLFFSGLLILIIVKSLMYWET
jgi:hypothetical protein